MRFSHYLKPNFGCEIPSNLLIVDTEATIKHEKDGSQSQTFRLGYAIHLMLRNKDWSESGYELHSLDDFWNLLDRFNYPKKKLIVIAHNMAYDYAILKMDSYFSSRNLEIETRIIDTAFIIRAGNIILISSTNFYRQSLEELGKIFGLSKMEKPDFEHCTDSELMPYCTRDTQVLTHVMKLHLAFIQDNDLGNFRPTIAGQAFNAYRHRFMKYKLLAHDNKDILELEGKSYRGGRCEAFRIGKFDNITCLDINSMYPFIMKTKLFPTSLATSATMNGKISHDCEVSDLIDAIKSGYFILADCDMILKKPVIACKRDKLLFPIGNVNQVITSPEIQFLIDNPEAGTIVNAKSMVIYNQAQIFSEYVDFFYAFRKTTENLAYKEMSKVMLNSLYGKYAQHCRTEIEIVKDSVLAKMYISMMNESNTHEILTDVGSKYVRLGDFIYRITSDFSEYSKDAIPIIASAVTSYARILLWNLIEMAGSENVIYCDTDSLFVNESGYANLSSQVSKSELGKLKLEKSGTVEIFGAKDYIFNEIVKLKGIKKNAVKLPDGSYKQYQFQTKNSRYLNGTPDGIVILKPIIKTLSRNYDKGFVIDGKVKPFSFSDFP